nr:HYR domain-containing protein [Chitinophagales bacterium]
MEHFFNAVCKSLRIKNLQLFSLVILFLFIQFLVKADGGYPTGVVASYNDATQELTLTVNWSFASIKSNKAIGVATFADLNGDGILPQPSDNPYTWTSGGNLSAGSTTAMDEFLGQMATSDIDGFASAASYPSGDYTDIGIASGVIGIYATTPRVLFPYGLDEPYPNKTGTFTIVYSNVTVAPTSVCVAIYDVKTKVIFGVRVVKNLGGSRSPRSASLFYNYNNSIDEDNGDGCASLATLVALNCASDTTIASCQTQDEVDAAYASWLATTTASGGCSTELTNNSTGAPLACGGIKTVTFTYTSSCAPLITTCSATFTVVADETDPEIICPDNINICIESGATNASINFGTATATDNCAGAITITNNLSESTTYNFPLGTTEIIWTAIDACGNDVTCVQTVTVYSESSATVEATICEGEIYILPDGLEATTTDTYITSFETASGCDSVITTNLIVNALPLAFAGADKAIDCIDSIAILDGSSDMLDVTYAWESNDGGHIISGADTPNPEVDAVGTYVLTVTNSITGCISLTDAVSVIEGPCIFPIVNAPETGKTDDVIGSELFSLSENPEGDVSPLSNIFFFSGDSIYIEIIYNTGHYDDVINLLTTPEYGLTNILDNGDYELIITGLFPIAHLPLLNELPEIINYARPLYQPLSNSGIAYTLGDKAMRSDFVRTGYGLEGDGIKIGVLSDSYNKIAGDPAAIDVANKDLPGIANPDYPTPVHVLKDYPFGVRLDEGRAMLQLIHDIAPKAELAFRTGFISAGDFSVGIKALRDDSCDIIVDDITYIYEPFFQDGIVAQAVDEVVDDGVVYFSAAGNFGSKAYESTFNGVAPPAGLTGYAHDFSGGDIFQSVTFAPGTYTIVLQWSDSIYSIGQTYTGTQNDLDIYLAYDNGNTLFGLNRDNTNGDPVEVLSFTVPDS